MTPSPHTLSTPDGDLAYEVHGPDHGPLALCLPGMGDLRSAYRFVNDALATQGWRVALVDLPGHGDSTVGATPSQTRIGEHAAALVEQLGGPAVVIGHSYTPDSALVAAQRCEQVRAVVCVAPWASTPAMTAPVRALSTLVASNPRLWAMFYRSLNKQPAPDLPAHLARIRASLRRPNGTHTLRAMARGDRARRRGGWRPCLGRG